MSYRYELLGFGPEAVEPGKVRYYIDYYDKNDMHYANCVTRIYISYIRYEMLRDYYDVYGCHGPVDDMANYIIEQTTKENVKENEENKDVEERYIFNALGYVDNWTDNKRILANLADSKRKHYIKYYDKYDTYYFNCVHEIEIDEDTFLGLKKYYDIRGCDAFFCCVVNNIIKTKKEGNSNMYNYNKMMIECDAEIKELQKNLRPSSPIHKVIFHDPATIVYWSDGTKTVVKCSDKDTFDPEKGLAMAILKKEHGDDYYKVIKKWLKSAKNYDEEDDTKEMEEAVNNLVQSPSIKEAVDDMCKTIDDFFTAIKNYKKSNEDGDKE